VADAGEAAAALLDCLEPRANGSAWVEDFRARRAAMLAERAERASEPADSIQPGRVFAEIQRALPRRAIVTLDAGTCSLQATDALQTFEPPALLTPLDLGLVGFSFAAGLGAKAAAPDRPVLSIMGDGGFGMTLGEIGTAVASGLHTVTVVMNNGCWGAEKAYQRDFFGGRYVGADPHNPDFAAVARAFGAHGVRVEDPGDIAAAVHEAFALDRPSVIEVPVDPDAIVSFRRDAFAHRLPAPDPVA
jgi:acetolactate synthase-1/2/3 large subunit/sulfoacetaldehyde acetyltransferase